MMLSYYWRGDGIFLFMGDQAFKPSIESGANLLGMWFCLFKVTIYELAIDLGDYLFTDCACCNVDRNL